MSGWPVIDREPVHLPTLPGHDDALWLTLIELCELRPGEWTLIGGQMVFLHAMENGAPPPRVSTDLDVLVNARIATAAVREFVGPINKIGFELVGASPEGIAHRYRRDGVRLDVLAPEGVGPRTELVPVTVGDHRGMVPRPSLFGAIIAKSAAIDVDDVPDAQRADLALLLSLVNDFALSLKWPMPTSEHGPPCRPTRPTAVAPRSGSSPSDRARMKRQGLDPLVVSVPSSRTTEGSVPASPSRQKQDLSACGLERASSAQTVHQPMTCNATG